MVNTSLKNHLVVIFEDTNLLPIKNPYTRYATNTTLALIEHLYKNYDHISGTDMEDNNKNLHLPCNYKEPLESLIKRINKCLEFAVVTSNLAAETQLICTTYGLVSEIGIYQEDCSVWRTNPNKEWPAFQSHFIKEQDDLLERQHTARQGEYGSNRMVLI